MFSGASAFSYGNIWSDYIMMVVNLQVTYVDL